MLWWARSAETWININFTPSSWERGLLIIKSCWPTAFLGFVMCWKERKYTQRSEAAGLQSLIKKIVTLLKVQLTISLTLLYHALSSLILLIHWLLSWGRTQRKSCQKKKTKKQENFYKNLKKMWNYAKRHHLKTEEDASVVLHTHHHSSSQLYVGW